MTDSHQQGDCCGRELESEVFYDAKVCNETYPKATCFMIPSKTSMRQLHAISFYFSNTVVGNRHILFNFSSKSLSNLYPALYAPPSRYSHALVYDCFLWYHATCFYEVLERCSHKFSSFFPKKDGEFMMLRHRDGERGSVRSWVDIARVFLSLAHGLVSLNQLKISSNDGIKQ